MYKLVFLGAAFISSCSFACVDEYVEPEDGAIAITQVFEKLPTDRPARYVNYTARQMYDLWESGRIVSSGPQRIMGSYDRGCLIGASTLPLEGLGYKVVTATKNRFYGHQSLVSFITRLATSVAKKDLGELFVADLGPPRGGPMRTGHMSHQVGLDVDLRFTLENVSMVNNGQLHADWKPRYVDWIRLAAQDSEVERIFLNPVLKRELCRYPQNHSWLHKVRPWWGHDSHFHVRLACPKGEDLCQPQAKVNPKEDTCGAALDWWFSQEARDEADRLSKGAWRGERPFPQIPTACYDLLD